jgi:hypothetical protein
MDWAWRMDGIESKWVDHASLTGTLGDSTGSSMMLKRGSVLPKRRSMAMVQCSDGLVGGDRAEQINQPTLVPSTEVGANYGDTAVMNASHAHTIG